MGKLPSNFLNNCGDGIDFGLQRDHHSIGFAAQGHLPFEHERSRFPSEDFSYTLNRRFDNPMSPANEMYIRDKSEPQTPYAFDSGMLPQDPGMLIHKTGLELVVDEGFETKHVWDEAKRSKGSSKQCSVVQSDSESEEESDDPPEKKLEGEEERINAKIRKTALFWGKESRLIPNVFKLTKTLEEEPGLLFEHQDLSMKELLVMNYTISKKIKKQKFQTQKRDGQSVDEDQGLQPKCEEFPDRNSSPQNHHDSENFDEDENDDD